MKVINPLKGKSNKSWFFEQQVYSPDGIARAVKSTDGSGNVPKITDMKTQKQPINLPPELQGKKFRIRKLTPRECFRLMDVDDADIDKMQASGLSNSAQYKLAGNSICCNVLYWIFYKAFIDTTNGNEQLSLF